MNGYTGKSTANTLSQSEKSSRLQVRYPRLLQRLFFGFRRTVRMVRKILSKFSGLVCIFALPFGEERQSPV